MNRNANSKNHIMMAGKPFCFGIMAIGSSVFIGTLFTLPFSTILLLLAYDDRTGEVAVVKKGI